MTERATDGIEPADAGGDPPCWAHLFVDDDLPVDALAGSEGEGPPDEPGGVVVDGGHE